MSRPAIPMNLDLREYPDGARYRLPRRRRGGTAPIFIRAGIGLLGLVAVGTFFYLSFSNDRPSDWRTVKAIGLAVVLVLVLIPLLRMALALLLEPETEIELRDGTLSAEHTVLGRGKTFEVAAGQVERLVIRPTGDEESIPFGLSEEHLAALRQFGSLTVEGSKTEPVVLAQGYGRRHLTALAEDLARRLDGDTQRVTVEQKEPSSESEDEPVERPDECAVELHEDGNEMRIEVPPASEILGKPALQALGAGVAIVAMGAGLLTMPLWLVTKFQERLWVAPVLGGAIVIGGFLLLRYGIKIRGFSKQRVTFSIREGWLSITYHEKEAVNRKLEWRPDELAAAIVDFSQPSGDALPVYELVLFDQACGNTTVLRGRPEDETAWLAAVLRRVLDLPGPKDEADA